MYAPKAKYVIPFITLGSLCCYGLAPCLILLQHHIGLETHISICDGDRKRQRNWLIICIWLIFLVGMTLVGLYCDKSLYDFVKKQHQSSNNQAQLVAWKSTNFSVEEDLQVPIKATAMSLFLIVFSVLFVVMCLIYSHDQVI